jgi:hypothetical protein
VLAFLPGAIFAFMNLHKWLMHTPATSQWMRKKVVELGRDIQGRGEPRQGRIKYYRWCDEGEYIIPTRCRETWGGESMAAA